MAQTMNLSPGARKLKISVILFGLLATSVTLAGCSSSNDVLSHGYQLNEETLALVPEGSSREQVLLSLGTPSTTNSTPGGSETFYYISQKKARTFAFQKPTVVEQRVLAIYMNDENTVDRIANYGLKEGKVFDFVARVTPTGGKELSFLNQLLRSGGAFNPFGRS